MRPAAALGFGVLGAILSANSAGAGAWTQPKGKGQVILKAEAMRAKEAFDPDGRRVPLTVERGDNVLGAFAEYGFTDRLTLQLKADWQDGEDQFVDYQGSGPIEAALVWQVWRGERTALSVQAGYTNAGEGRHAGYSAPGVGRHDWEARTSVGSSFGPLKTRGFGLDGSFVEIQAARRFRSGLPDEFRSDVTVGAHVGGRWLLLAQAFGGRVDGGEARWLSIETSVVRHFQDWSVQAGWRDAVRGRETPVSRGAVLAVWRRF